MGDWICVIHGTFEATGRGSAVLEVDNLVCGYDGEDVVHGASFTVGDAEFVCVLGPNGCGKSTTMKALLGLLKPRSGDIRMNGASTLRLTERERARLFAYIPQAHTPPFPFTVADVVLLGRTPYVEGLARVTASDRRIAYDCMEMMGVLPFAERPYTQLSGGQQQLVLIARALAQQPLLLVMDEPTASLDFGNQHLVLQQMKGLAQAGTGVLMVTHDPDHALMCADRVVVMEEGRVIGQGAPDEVIDASCLQRIYRIAARVVEVSINGTPLHLCVPDPAAQGEGA